MSLRSGLVTRTQRVLALAVASGLLLGTFAPATVTVAAPAYQERPLEELVLKKDEAGDNVKSTSTKSGSDGRASWFEVTHKRDSADHKRGPVLMVNRVYRASDAGTAQQIYNEQVNAGLPEARALNFGIHSMGSQALPGSIGEELFALGACEIEECHPGRGDLITRHYRMVMRFGNLVETLYTYGPDTGNNFNVVFSFGNEIQRRITTLPEGPAPELFSTMSPVAIALSINDAGKEATEMFSRGGSDERSSWHEARFERGEAAITQKLGPTHLYSKVFVANSSEAAQAIFNENAVKNLPEATEKHGAVFVEEKTKSFGNQSFAVGACNDNCETALTDRLHERLVYRWGNVVVILYTWGRDDNSNPEWISYFGDLVTARIQ